MVVQSAKVYLSTIEVEFTVIAKACKKLLCLKKFLQELEFVQDKYVLSVDSKIIIHFGKNSNFYNRSKQINVRYHWIHNILDAKLLELTKVHMDDNILI